MTLRDRIEDILTSFGDGAYWYGEDTGDYSMKCLRDSPPEFFTTAADQLEALLSGDSWAVTEPEVQP